MLKMRRLAFIATLLSLFALTSLAEDDAKVIKQNGIDYVCFDTIAGQILLDMRLKYPLLDQENDLLKTQLKIKESQIIKWQDGADNLTSQLTILTDQNGDLQKRIESSDAWYKSNILWTAVGFVVGIGVTIGVVKAVTH